MKLLSIANVLALAASVTAHTEDDIKLEDSEVSLPDLERMDVFDGPSDASFVGGRIILTSSANTKSSLKNENAINYDTWTIESVFRSSGSIGKTGSSFTLNYVKEHDVKNKLFFGGASRFDGIRIVVDSDSQYGSAVHAFLNDGSIDYSDFNGAALYEKAFGSCLLAYQDSQVPTTLRLAQYDGSLLVQVNNQVCIKTKKVQLPKHYKIGADAITSGEKEQFELLRLKTYKGVLSEITENEGKVAPQAQVITEYVQLDENGEPIGKISKPNVELPAEQQAILGENYQSSLNEIQKNNKEVIDSLLRLDAKINGLSVNSKGKQADFSFLEDHVKTLKSLKEIISNLQGKVNDLDTRFINLERKISSEVVALTAAVNRLSNDNINQLRDNEHSIDELNKSIQFLILSEKERQENPVETLISGLKYFLFPILVIVGALSFFTYRLRHEIKTKLL